ncbi:MAG TPA: FAD-dependent oxidoreductase, partial [Pyrinomonadaceae bacterium]|nr:FAD-dependent oxidoreductase [Pyrinomonadaceae bacterium]
MYEVVVVGGGVGGLTAAALLAARGLSVCLLERGPDAGGCAAAFEHAGRRYEPGAGLYSCWQRGDIHERVFAELPVGPPEVELIRTPYVVHLPDGARVRVGLPSGEHFAELRAAFPECAGEAERFYLELAPVAEALHDAALRSPGLAAASPLERLKLLARAGRESTKILAGMGKRAADYLGGTSPRFRRFIDAQLQIFAQAPSRDCAYLYAAVALAQPLRGMYTMRGGAQSLPDSLAESIRKSGSTVRLNTPALRLAYDSRGRAAGVQLLSGETVEAGRAVIS